MATEDGKVEVVAEREQPPIKPVQKPLLGGSFELDTAVVDALPVPGTKVLSARNYGMSLWGRTAKIVAELPTGEVKSYFLKVEALGDLGRVMLQGEYESMKAMHKVLPRFVPTPYAWGRYKNATPDTYFLLLEFRHVGQQPPDPMKFVSELAKLHTRSVSPTGKFGFHITTCHAKLLQITDCWEESWEVLFKKQMAHMINLDREKRGDWDEFQAVCALLLEKVIPRLLRPLQSEGRSIKPCLVHGNLWDENTAGDKTTGRPFVYDACSFYAHNEYEIGDWRSVRHRLSSRTYVKKYLKKMPASQPEADWDDRNLLYSLRFDLGAAVLIPGSTLRVLVKDNMTILCKKLFPKEYKALSDKMILYKGLAGPASIGSGEEQTDSEAPSESDSD